MDAGHRQVQGRLLVGFEAEIRKVVRVGVHPVADLFVGLDRLGQDRHTLVPQEPLVSLERLTAGIVTVGIAGHPVGDLPQTERSAGVEQDQQQVRHSFESVGVGHSRQSTGRGAERVP